MKDSGHYLANTNVGKNTLEEMEYPHSQQEFRMKYLGTISKTTE